MSCIHASRIVLSGTYISQFENEECGTSVVTPSDICWYKPLLGLRLGRENGNIFIPLTS